LNFWFLKFLKSEKINNNLWGEKIDNIIVKTDKERSLNEIKMFLIYVYENQSKLSFLKETGRVLLKKTSWWINALSVTLNPPPPSAWVVNSD
jgi:hypothetical protein